MKLSYYERNKERVKKAARARYHSKREQIREEQNLKRQSPEAKLRARSYQLLKKFGITLEEYDRMLVSQNGVCAICNSSPSGRWNRLHVDRDHETGIVRGLLCHDCNTGIGLLKDNPNLIETAAQYVRSKKN